VVISIVELIRRDSWKYELAWDSLKCSGFSAGPKRHSESMDLAAGTADFVLFEVCDISSGTHDKPHPARRDQKLTIAD
jgi:hypothetical protein